MLKYVFAWVPMVLIGIANGVLRATTYGSHMSGLHAHELSTLTGGVMLSVYIYGVSRFLRFETGRQAIAVGVMWFAMTVGFEFAFGHYIAGHDWTRLVRDYNLLEGRVWLLLLLWVAGAPYVFYRLRK
jgi:hypothetical protein